MPDSLRSFGTRDRGWGGGATARTCDCGMCRVWKCGRVSCAAPCAALTEHTAQRVEESWSSWREARGLGSAGSESETAPDRTWTEVGALSRSLSFGSTCTLQQLRKAVSCIRLKRLNALDPHSHAPDTRQSPSDGPRTREARTELATTAAHIRHRMREPPLCGSV
jgi:hypothetical protein